MKIKTTIYMMIAAMICGIFVGCSGHKAALSLAPEGETWHDMTLPVKLSLKSPTSFSMGGRATIVRDSVVYMSFRVLGFEAAVLNVTADSVFLWTSTTSISLQSRWMQSSDIIAKTWA